MAIQIGTNPYTFDAVGQAYTNKIKVAAFRFMGGTASGKCVVKAYAGGPVIWESRAVDPDDSDILELGEGIWHKSIYIDQLPAGGILYVSIK